MAADKPHLASGVVILIGLFISLGLIFLLIVLGVYIDRMRRRREGYITLTGRDKNEIQRIAPEDLISTFNRTTTTNSRPGSSASSIQPSVYSTGISRRSSSSIARSSIRSFTSFFTDSSSWDSDSRRRSGRALSTGSGLSSRSSWLDFMSNTSTPDDPEWRRDELGAAARMEVVYNMELRQVPPTARANSAHLVRITE
jgi:hypothetical protein